MKDRQLIPEGDQFVAQGLKNALAEIEREDGKRQRLSTDQVMDLLPQRLGTIRLNVRSREVLTDKGILTAADIDRLYLRLSSRAETWPKQTTADAAMELASANSFDPVIEYLNGIQVEPLPLEQWQRLDQCLLGIDDPIAASFLPRYFISAVARAFEPGCGMRQTPVLVGAQWRGKTELGQILFGAAHWIEGLHGRNEVDQRTRCHTAWGVELSELDGITRRADQESLKAFLTERVDVVRRAYGKGEERLPRRFVFWGTSNGPPLRDPTGNTRFVCIALPDRMLPLQWAAEHRDALWARALELYRAGVQWDRCSQDERDAIALRNEDFAELDPWADKVLPYLARRVEADTLPVTVSDLLNHLEVPTERQTTAIAKRVRQIAEAAGWKHGRRWVGRARPQGLWPADGGQAYGHTGHPPDTPRCVRGEPRQEAGLPRIGHPGHPYQALRGFEEEGEGEKRGKEVDWGVHIADPRQTPAPQGITAPRGGVQRGVHWGVQGVSTAVCGAVFEPGELVEVRDAYRKWTPGHTVLSGLDAEGLVRLRSRTGRVQHRRPKDIRRPAA